MIKVEVKQVREFGLVMFAVFVNGTLSTKTWSRELAYAHAVKLNSQIVKHK